FPFSGRERPDVGERAAVLLGKGGGRFRLFEGFPEIGRAQHLHPEEGIARGGVHHRLAARVEKGRVDADAGREGTAQVERPARLRPLRDEQALFRSDGDKDAIRHLQPPETAGRMMTTSPGPSAVSSPSRSRMCCWFTNRLTWGRTFPVSSQRLRCRAG